MDVLLPQLVNGLALGSVYAVFGIGFGLMLATLGVLNAAHGAFATWGALAALYVTNSLGLSFWIALPAGVVAAGLISLVVDVVAFQPLRRRSKDMVPALITSIGVWIALLALARIVTEARTERFDPARTPSGRWSIGPLDVPVSQVLAVVVLVLLAGGLHLLLTRTGTGAAMRAVGFAPQSAELGGVNPVRILGLTAFAAGAAAGAAGVLTGLATSTISFTLGEGLLLKGFAAVIIGGFGDVRGTVVGGLLIGVCEVLAAQYLGGSARDAITFGLLLAFLVARPKGLFGSATVVGRA